MKATPDAQNWNRMVSATIGASIAQTRQQHRCQAARSWWLDVPRDQWRRAVNAETPRLRRSRWGRWVSSPVIAWPV